MNLQRSGVRHLSLTASALLTALLLGACGGGGDDSFASAAPMQESAVQTATATPSAAPAGAEAAAPAPATSTSTSTTDTASAPQPTSPAGPPRSGRSLNWWGTAPLDLFNENQNCAPQPTCRIPDGDLAVWNATCEPGDLSCHVPLSTEPQIAPLPRSEEPAKALAQASL